MTARRLRVAGEVDGRAGDAAIERLEERDARATVLLRAVARGDEPAFAELFDVVSPMVWRIVRRVVRNEALSEEVAQEVFVELWRTAARFDERKGSVAAWVSVLAHRRAVDRVRSEQATQDRHDRVGRLDARTGDEPVADPVGVEVAEGLGHVDDLRRVTRALGSLTPLQRESIELAYYQGRTYPQIAAHLGVPLGTVKTRIRDGLIRLRDELGVSA